MIHLTDVFILLLLAWGGYKGFQKAFFTEFLSLLIFVVVTLLSFKLVHLAFDFGIQYSSKLSKVSKIPKGVPFFILLAIFIGISLGLNIWGRKRLERENGINVFDNFDNFMGLLIGLFKYVLAISLVFWLSTKVGLIQPEYKIHTTYFYPLMMKFFTGLLDVMSNVLPFLRDLERGTENLLDN
jgi:membrane protein required for colicin V production